MHDVIQREILMIHPSEFVPRCRSQVFLHGGELLADGLSMIWGADIFRALWLIRKGDIKTR
jgi:hypothetical protein